MSFVVAALDRPFGKVVEVLKDHGDDLEAAATHSGQLGRGFAIRVREGERIRGPDHRESAAIGRLFAEMSK